MRYVWRLGSNVAEIAKTMLTFFAKPVGASLVFREGSIVLAFANIMVTREA